MLIRSVGRSLNIVHAYTMQVIQYLSGIGMCTNGYWIKLVLLAGEVNVGLPMVYCHTTPVQLQKNMTHTSYSASILLPT